MSTPKLGVVQDYCTFCHKSVYTKFVHRCAAGENKFPNINCPGNFVHGMTADFSEVPAHMYPPSMWPAIRNQVLEATNEVTSARVISLLDKAVRGMLAVHNASYVSEGAVASPTLTAKSEMPELQLTELAELNRIQQVFKCHVDLWAPVEDYLRKHPEMKLGGSIPEFCLQLLKERDERKKLNISPADRMRCMIKQTQQMEELLKDLRNSLYHT